MGSLNLNGRMHYLDALRGLAAVAVMLFHFFVADVSPIHSELAATLPAFASWTFAHLFLGVEIFFVLSGFVIAHSMHNDTPNLRYAGNFILRRSLRLDPPYWTAMAIMLAYYIVRWPSDWYNFYLEFGGYKGLAANMFYIQNLSFYPAGSVLDVSWTLCLEVQFYLSYLLILVVCHYIFVLAKGRGASARPTAIALAVAAVGVWSLSHWLRHPGNGFDSRAWMFFLGVGLFFILKRNIAIRTALAALLVLLGWFIWKPDPEGIATVATAGSILIVGATGRLSTLFAYRPLLFLGSVSYSLYLLHLVVGGNLLQYLSTWADGNSLRAWSAWTLAIASSLLSATFLQFLVEAPSNRLSQRLKPKTPHRP